MPTYFRYDPDFPYDEYGREGSQGSGFSPHQDPTGYSRQDSGYSHHDQGYPSGRTSSSNATGIFEVWKKLNMSNVLGIVHCLLNLPIYICQVPQENIRNICTPKSTLWIRIRIDPFHLAGSGSVLDNPDTDPGKSLFFVTLR